MARFFVYALTNESRSVLYIGLTNDLYRRMCEHRNETVEGFTKRYHVHKLVYFEEYQSITDAIAREKQLKGWRREKKIALIQLKNPTWNDLFEP